MLVYLLLGSGESGRPHLLEILLDIIHWSPSVVAGNPFFNVYDSQ